MKELYICSYNNNSNTFNICCSDSYFKCINYILYNNTFEDNIEEWKNNTFKNMSLSERRELYKEDDSNIIKIKKNCYITIHKINYIE